MKCYINFVNIKNRTRAGFSQVSYIVQHFTGLLPYSSTKSQIKLFSEFSDYQIIQDTLIPSRVWDNAKVLEKEDDEETVEYHRMDILWGYNSGVKDDVTSQPSSLLTTCS